MIRGRLRRRRGVRAQAGDEYVEIDAAELVGIFAAPQWLRDLGLMAWLLVGVTLAVAGAVWLLTLTQVIVIPVITASIIAAVASPLVRLLQRGRIPRAVGAVLVLVGLVAVGVGTFLLVIGGITDESGAIASHLGSAADTVSGWLKDLGIDPSKADGAEHDATTSISSSVGALLNGLGAGLERLASLAFFLAMTVLSLFFLLKDGPAIREWGERHLGVPVPVAETIVSRMLGALRGYFLGVTIVGAFNGVVVGVGALVLGVPLAGTIAIVTFLASYVPYLGAWTAGAFAVLIALGDGGTDAALAMAVVVLLANGALQQLIQPFAYGAALGIHPLAVLVVTIGGGAVFGTIGLILAAPLLSAATRISADLARARAEEDAHAESSAAAEPPPIGPEPQPSG
jgi:predicted PurR-regulated permease PerM